MKKHITIDAHTPMTGALNFSHLLDAPAGKHGFVQAHDGHLLFENGQRARFFGFNFPGGGMMPTHETAEKYAERLATMGCNVVRLHAADHLRTNKISLIDYSKGNSLELDPVSLDRVHYFISQLKRRGVYVQVDLYCYRAFLSGDELDYPGEPNRPVKSVTYYNKRLIELQKEYARRYLTAVNPYTGLALTDEPAVMCVQITNENSLFWGGPSDLAMPTGRQPYEQELKARFNCWLLEQYHSRDGLVQAWTREGECALQGDEDPAKGTVQTWPLGDFCQPWVDHRAWWTGTESPARYADYVRFGTELMRNYYREMRDYLIEIGVKVPINGNNLTNGVADIYASANTDLMEDNAYYNHPLGDAKATSFHFRESVRMDPRTTTYPDYRVRDNHLLQQLASSCVSGKPFVVSEWNEYAGMPFHSTSFIAQAAYACLQDWDGLILYAYCHANDYNDINTERMTHVYAAFNDPSFTCQIGVLASIFLQGLVKSARNLIDVCYTREDIQMLPENFKMPYGFAPFISRIRTKFLDESNRYTGAADVALSSGFSSGGDLTDANHAIVYARSPYADALQHQYVGQAFLNSHRALDNRPLLRLATLDDHTAVIDETNAIERTVDHTGFSRIMDAAMKQWGLLDTDKGLSEPKTFVSDTGEIRFAFGDSQFLIRAEQVSVFSGYAGGQPVDMGCGYTAHIENEKMSLSVLSLDGKLLNESGRVLVIAIGETGNDGNTWAGEVLLSYGGRLYIDHIEGRMDIAGVSGVRAWALNVYGVKEEPLCCEPTKNGVSVHFTDEGTGAAYEIEIER